LFPAGSSEMFFGYAQCFRSGKCLETGFEISRLSHPGRFDPGK
jgi:hypothetical protein